MYTFGHIINENQIILFIEQFKSSDIILTLCQQDVQIAKGEYSGF